MTDNDKFFDVYIKAFIVIVSIFIILFSIWFLYIIFNSAFGEQYNNNGYPKTEEEDEKEHEEWAKENYPDQYYDENGYPIIEHQSLNTSSNNNNIKILVCGPIHKLMEQWLKPNEYKCHKA